MPRLFSTGGNFHLHFVNPSYLKNAGNLPLNGLDEWDIHKLGWFKSRKFRDHIDPTGHQIRQAFGAQVSNCQKNRVFSEVSKNKNNVTSQPCSRDLLTLFFLQLPVLLLVVPELGSAVIRAAGRVHVSLRAVSSGLEASCRDRPQGISSSHAHHAT